MLLVQALFQKFWFLHIMHREYEPMFLRHPSWPSIAQPRQKNNALLVLFLFLKNIVFFTSNLKMFSTSTVFIHMIMSCWAHNTQWVCKYHLLRRIICKTKLSSSKNQNKHSTCNLHMLLLVPFLARIVGLHTTWSTTIMFQNQAAWRSKKSKS